MQEVCTKHRHTFNKLHFIAKQQAITIIFTAMSTSNLKRACCPFMHGEGQLQATFHSQNVKKQNFPYVIDTNSFSLIRKWFYSFIHGL